MTILLNPEVRASAADMKWSPDSRTLVADGVIYARPRSMLYTVSVPEGKVTVLDTLAVLAGYEFSWSPDGRWIAFSRPTRLDRLSEDPVAADLWIADARTGATWLVLETPDWIESNPLWITNRTIQVDRVHWDGSEPGVEQWSVDFPKGCAARQIDMAYW
jgi:Tol biopolymer transport system component